MHRLIPKMKERVILLGFILILVTWLIYRHKELEVNSGSRVQERIPLAAHNPISYRETKQNKVKPSKTHETSLTLDLDLILRSADTPWPVVVMGTGARTGNCLNTYAISLALRKEFGANATFAIRRHVFDMINKVMDTEGLIQPIVEKTFTNKATDMKMIAWPPKEFRSQKNLVAHLKPSIKYEITNFKNSHKKKVLLLEGSFNRMYMIADHINEIRRSFRLKLNLIEKAQIFLHKVSEGLGSDLVFVGFHIRRTDYVKHSKNYNGASVPGPRYYADALAYYRQRNENVLFVVASDDLSHAKSHLQHHQDVVFTEMKTLQEDMALLASCNHSIMTVGSFGWWSSFLAGGDVVYALLNNFTIPPFAHPEMMGDHGFENFHGIPVL